MSDPVGDYIALLAEDARKRKGRDARATHAHGALPRCQMPESSGARVIATQAGYQGA